MVLRDATIQIMFLFAAWRAIETLAPTDTLASHGLALGLLVIYQAAIQTKLLIICGPSEDCWYYIETAVLEEKRRNEAGMPALASSTSGVIGKPDAGVEL